MKEIKRPETSSLLLSDECSIYFFFVSSLLFHKNGNDPIGKDWREKDQRDVDGSSTGFQLNLIKQKRPKKENEKEERKMKVIERRKKKKYILVGRKPM